MEEKTSETSPLTLKELGEMLVRHAENSPIGTVIKAAMTRRRPETSEVPVSHTSGIRRTGHME